MAFNIFILHLVECFLIIVLYNYNYVYTIDLFINNP